MIFYTHNGCLTNRWFPKIEDGPLTAEHLAGTTLAGLTPFASKLLFPRGLKMFNSYAEIQSIDPHDQAMGGKLTCALISDDKTRYATSHSLDHEIAKQINPGKEFPGVVILQVDKRVPALVVKSVFQTAAFAGYPNVSFMVGRLGETK